MSQPLTFGKNVPYIITYRKNSLLCQRDRPVEADSLEPDESANGARRVLHGLSSGDLIYNHCWYAMH